MVQQFCSGGSSDGVWSLVVFYAGESNGDCSIAVPCVNNTIGASDSPLLLMTSSFSK